MKKRWLVIKKPAKEKLYQATVEESPFDLKIKWTPPDGVVLLAALSFMKKHLLNDKRKNTEDWFATYAEAFGVESGKRVPTEKQLERLAKQLFAILTKSKKRKLERHMHDMVFWPGFRGGFIHATHSPTY